MVLLVCGFCESLSLTIIGLFTDKIIIDISGIIKDRLEVREEGNAV